MSLRKDKKKVIGESFSDERIKTFLDVQAPDGVNPDFHALEKAYRSMIAENFATFIGFFVEAGRDLNAPSPQGQTLLQEVKSHRHGEEYAEILQNAGAK